MDRNYTARGQLKNVGWSVGATSYVYWPDGKVNYQARTNGVTTTFDYNGRGMIQSVSHKNAGGQNLARREYWRDNRDRIVARGSVERTIITTRWRMGVATATPTTPRGNCTKASYRALNPEPLATLSDAKRSDSFSYDALDNRQGSNNYVASLGAMSFTRRNNGLNQYLNWTPSVIYHDDNHPGPPAWVFPGNGVTMAEGWITASYNALNQPMAMWCSTYGNNYLWFGHDPLGRCVKRWMGTSTGTPVGSNPTTYFCYEGWNLVQEGPNAATSGRTYVHGGRVDEIVASEAGGVWRNHHYDARGHCILLTDTGGTIREQYDYDAFGFRYLYTASGGKLSASQQFGNRFLFTGREWLRDLRIYDYRHRHYQPELGRFLQPDPKQFEAGDYNLYRYCHNDPVNRTDPTGLIDDGGVSSNWRDLKGGLTAEQERMLDRVLKHVGERLRAAWNEQIRDIKDNPLPYLAAAAMMGKGPKPRAAAPGTYRPPAPLPRGPNGEPVPSSQNAHTQIGTGVGRHGPYTAAREGGQT